MIPLVLILFQNVMQLNSLDGNLNVSVSAIKNLAESSFTDGKSIMYHYLPFHCLTVYIY